MKELIEIQKELIKEMPFKWRVQSCSKFKAEATCVAYVDSRQVQTMLDDNCQWSDRYYEEGGLLFCEITIHTKDGVFKRSDTGSESNVDKEKGHSSDAFKRAAVKFGVGRFLYSQKMQKVKTNEIKKQGNYPYAVDNNGSRVWDITKHINNSLGKAPIKKPTKPLDLTRQKTALKACKTKVEVRSFYDRLSETEKTAMKTLCTEFTLTLETK